MRVLGLDSSMCNSGYIILDVDPSKLRPHQSPHSTHVLMGYVSSGTFTHDDSDETRLERLIDNSNEVLDLCSKYRPDLVVIEGALDKGASRSSTGTALYCLITSQWHPRTKKIGQTNVAERFVPSVVVTISPERHMSMAHQKRSLTGTEKVQRYRELATESPKGRVSVHVADSYFLAYHGIRFWLTLKTVWPMSILTPHEKAIFHDNSVIHPIRKRPIASKCMVNERGYSWWENEAPQVQEPSPLTFPQ